MRSVQGGAAMPVVITGTEDVSGNLNATGSEVLVNELQFNPVGAHSDGASIATAATLTAPAGANKLLIQALSQNVRYTLDGTVPTASLGFQLKAGDPPVIIPIGANTTVKVIQEAATADLQYQFGA